MAIPDQPREFHAGDGALGHDRPVRGEYAVVEYTPGKLNMQIWDFTWKPGAKYVPDPRYAPPTVVK